MHLDPSNKINNSNTVHKPMWSKLNYDLAPVVFVELLCLRVRTRNPVFSIMVLNVAFFET